MQKWIDEPGDEDHKAWATAYGDTLAEVKEKVIVFLSDREKATFSLKPVVTPHPYDKSKNHHFPGLEAMSKTERDIQEYNNKQVNARNNGGPRAMFGIGRHPKLVKKQRNREQEHEDQKKKAMTELGGNPYMEMEMECQLMNLKTAAFGSAHALRADINNPETRKWAEKDEVAVKQHESKMLQTRREIFQKMKANVEAGGKGQEYVNSVLHPETVCLYKFNGRFAEIDKKIAKKEKEKELNMKATMQAFQKQSDKMKEQIRKRQRTSPEYQPS